MRSFFKGRVHNTPHSMNKIQNRRRLRCQNRLHDQPATLVQYRNRNRVPMDIQSDISHTIHWGVPLRKLWLTASAQQPQLTRKGRPLIRSEEHTSELQSL